MRQVLSVLKRKNPEEGKPPFLLRPPQGVAISDVFSLITLGLHTILTPNPDEKPELGVKRTLEYRRGSGDDDEEYVEVVWRQRVVGGGFEIIVSWCLHDRDEGSDEITEREKLVLIEMLNVMLEATTQNLARQEMFAQAMAGAAMQQGGNSRQ